MKYGLRRCLLVLCALAVTRAAFATDNDDDAKPAAGASGELPSLSADQQHAAGILVAHPVNAEISPHSDAIGLVLDPVALVTDAGEAEATASAARAAAAEVERVRSLYGAGAGASLKALQSAQAEQARIRAQADVAAAKFASHWKPIAALPANARQKLIDEAVAGTVLLVRADLTGRHVIGSLPDRALLDVDGIGVPGKVLGVVAQTTEEAQGIGLLVEVHSAPAGLGLGARIPVLLLGAKLTGVLVSRDAVLYDDGGALVYKQLAATPGDRQTRYAPVRVKLLQAHGDSWLVDGIDDDDNIVVHGAGVLWSLQGIVGHAAGDNDDDD